MSKKYEEVKAFLKAEALKSESRLRMPTVAELMKRFRASQSPVIRAVHDLEAEGILYCRRGVGIVSRTDMPPFSIPAPAPTTNKTESGTIAFIVVDYFSSVIWRMTHSLNAYSRQLGLITQNYWLQRDCDRMRLVKEALELPDIKGIVLMPSADRLEGELLDYLGTLPLPVVILDSYFVYEGLADNISVLRPDAYENGILCMDYLYKAGHRKIGFVRSLPDGTIPQLMIEGATAFGNEHGMELKVLSCAVKSWDSVRDASRKITTDKLDEIRSGGFDALIYMGGGAISANRIFWKNHIRIPEDLSILAHGDDSMFDDCTPALTSTSTDFTQMSCDALDIIAGKQERQAEKLYRAVIVQRESVAENRMQEVQ